MKLFNLNKRLKKVKKKQVEIPENDFEKKNGVRWGRDVVSSRTIDSLMNWIMKIKKKKKINYTPMISFDRTKLKGNEIYANRMSDVSLSSIVFIMVLMSIKMHVGCRPVTSIYESYESS